MDFKHKEKKMTKTLKRMIELSEQGVPQHAIATTLNGENLLSPSGKKWTQSMVAGRLISAGIRKNKKFKKVRKSVMRERTTESTTTRTGTDSEALISLVIDANLTKEQKVQLLRVLL
jgi:hypothetical protein